MTGGKIQGGYNRGERTRGQKVGGELTWGGGEGEGRRK